MATIPELRQMIADRKTSRLEEQPEIKEEGLFQKVVDSVPKDLMFAPSLVQEVSRLPRQFEALEDAGLRAMTGLPIDEFLLQEIKKPAEVSPLDFISTQGRIRETMEVLLPKVKMPTEAEHVLAPGKTIVLSQLDMFREGFKEVADMVGFVLRPDQMFGMLPLMTGAFRLTSSSIKKLVGIIGKSGIKEGEAIEKVTEKIRKQLIKETGVEGEELNKYIDDFHNFGNNKGTGIEYESEGAKNIAAMFDRAETLSAKQKAFSPKRLFQTLRRRIVDVSGNVKSALLKEGDAGKTVVMNHDLIAGAHTKAIIEYNNAANKVYGKLSRNEIRQLNRMISSRNEISISRFRAERGIEDITRAEGRTVGEFVEFMDETPLELSKKLQERANIYFTEMRNQLTKLHDEGLLTDELFETLLSKGDYSPRAILKFIDPDRVAFNNQGGKITIPDSGLKRLREGTEALMETDSSLLLSQVISRTQARILRNRANQALHRLAEVNPDNGIVFLEKPIGVKGIKVFHGGSGRNISEFKPKGIGIHFGTKEQAKFVASTKGKAGAVQEFFLDIKNPVRLEDENAWGATPILKQLQKKGIITEEEFDSIVHTTDFKGFGLEDVRSVIREKGFDGIVYANKAEGAGDSFIPLHRNQINIKGQIDPNKSFEAVSVMVEGQQVEMFMPSEFAREWLIRDPEINSVLAETLGWLSGSKILKPMATGLNPGFALTNLPRDMAHAWLTTKEFSSFLPKAIGQIGRNTASVWNDAIFRKGAYLEYMNEGGGMEFMTHQGRVVNPMKGVLGKLQTYMGYVGETSEILGRLMLRQQAIRNGKSAQEATWIARNYLDFSQGGSAIKAVDTAVPYLNAGIQGTRGIIRAGIVDPATFTFKAAQVGTLATGLYLANKHTNPEGWAQVSDRDKVNNWIIMTPFSFTDKNGDKSYVFFKIAKDQGQRLFATAFENLMARYMGEDLNWTQVAQSIKDAIPASITTLPPTISAMLGYLSNKDFWLLEDVWKGHEQIEAGQEYHVDTPASFVTLGETTGLSPERTRFALAQLFTRGNIYTSLVGHGWNQLFDTMPESFREDTTNELILKQPIIKRMVNFTRPFTEFREPFKKIRKERATEEFVRNREFNRLSRGVINKKLDKKELNDFLREQPKEDRVRLKERHIQNKVLDKIPNKRLWLEILKTTDAKARAREFFLVFDKADEAEQRELNKSLNRIIGVKTATFQKELRKLKKENK